MSAADLVARTDFARRLAREAGALARRYFVHDIEFAAETKGPQDWVSVADRAVEDLVRERVVRAFPEDTVYGEEAGGEIGTRTWFIDPIDGTINFIRGVRYWCVSLAFVASGQTKIGAVYDPSLDELFWAAAGGGAWCGETRIGVAPGNRLDRALVCLGYVPRHALDVHLRLKRLLHEAGAAVKDMGAGALMLAHVAAGRYDAFIEPHMNPWDALAGLLLIEESGGRTLPYPGSGTLADGGPVLAAAPGVFDALAHLIARAGATL